MSIPSKMRLRYTISAGEINDYSFWEQLRFENDTTDTIFVKTSFENLVRLNDMINQVKDLVKPAELKQELIEGEISTDFDVKVFSTVHLS